MWPVGLLKPNGLGLFDMHGNAWERSHDLYASKSNDAVEVVVKNQESRVMRGGAFLALPENVGSASRTNFQPDGRLIDLGFRPARTYP
jgi:formylglycine-generating enzyme required for sulfatase activity